MIEMKISLQEVGGKIHVKCVNFAVGDVTKIEAAAFELVNEAAKAAVIAASEPGWKYLSTERAITIVP